MKALYCFLLLLPAFCTWSYSNHGAFDDSQLPSNWLVKEIRAINPRVAIEQDTDESWLTLSCEFGGRLHEATAFGVFAEDSEAEEFDVTARVQLQEGFLATLNLRSNEDSLSCYAGGISTSDRIYIIRIHGGKHKVLASLPLPSSQAGLHQDCWIRFKTERHRLYLKVWGTDETEPEDWQIESEDRRIRSGRAGLSISCYSPILGGQPAAVARFDQIRIILPERELIAAGDIPHRLGF